MSERRSLMEGIPTKTPVNPDLAEKFIRGESLPENAPTAKKMPFPSQQDAPSKLRVPVSTKLSPSVAHALKRASLDRQLKGIHPHTVQDITEEALRAWLDQHQEG